MCVFVSGAADLSFMQLFLPLPTTVPFCAVLCCVWQEVRVAAVLAAATEQATRDSMEATASGDPPANLAAEVLAGKRSLSVS